MRARNITGIIRIVPAFLLGVYVGVYHHINTVALLVVLAICMLTVFSFKIIVGSKKQYAYRWILGLSVQIAVFISAFFTTALKSEISYSIHYSKLDSCETYVCIVNKSPISKGKNFRFEVEIVEAYRDGHWLNVQGKCLMYIRNDSILTPIVYGDKLLFRQIPSKVEPPLNPGSFDFKTWLNNRQIFHQVFLKENDYILIDKDCAGWLMSKAIVWRNYLLKSIREAGIGGQEQAVLSALILGQDDEIDSELRNSYSTAGVMHILAVSGMHVGLIYGALCFLLKFPGTVKKFKWIKAAILVIALWLYAMLTGLSPSVLRASMMLSFIVIGISLERPANPLNVLVSSALFLFIIFSPNLIFSAGFQLSYLAVAGILFLYKPLHSLYSPSNWLVAQIWSILAVSVVAQAATFPLSVYYFHRFPNYFLISNLLVIPLGTVVIFGGIIVLFFSWWSQFSLILGSILSRLIKTLNFCVVELGSLPGSSTDSLYVSQEILILLYIALVFLALFFLKIKSKYLIWAISVFLIILGVKNFKKYSMIKQSFGIIYHCPRHSFIQFVNSKDAFSIVDSSLRSDIQSRKRISEIFLLEKGVNEKAKFSLSDSSLARYFNGLYIKLPFVEFNEKKIYILTDENKTQKPKFEMDFILVSGDPKVNLEKWLYKVKCRSLIVDASTPSFKRDKWKFHCENNGIVFIDVAKTGAFIF